VQVEAERFGAVLSLRTTGGRDGVVDIERLRRPGETAVVEPHEPVWLSDARERGDSRSRRRPTRGSWTVPLALGIITSYNIGVKVTLRRVGNSLGVIIPRATLEAWGLGEGDHLNLTERGIRPPARGGASSREVLEELKRKLAAAVAARFGAREIRAQILANLHRWEAQGAWVSAYDEWRELAVEEDDGALFAAMLGRDQRAKRLRESAPYVGLLSREEVTKLNEEAAG
jgi:antitoxin component of MazEF toxin-antitoxin module